MKGLRASSFPSLGQSIGKANWFESTQHHKTNYLKYTTQKRASSGLSITYLGKLNIELPTSVNSILFENKKEDIAVLTSHIGKVQHSFKHRYAKNIAHIFTTTQPTFV